MLRGTIEKIDGRRGLFEFTDHGEVRPGVFSASFRIDGGPFVLSEVDCSHLRDGDGSLAYQACSHRQSKDYELIRKAGGIPETVDFPASPIPN